MRKHGGEKGVPFRVQIDTFKENENGEYTEHLHSASCQIKVFKVPLPRCAPGLCCVLPQRDVAELAGGENPRSFWWLLLSWSGGAWAQLWLQNQEAKDNAVGSKRVVVLPSQSSHIQLRVLPSWEVLGGF